MWSLRLGHLESYFGRPARLARRPPSPGRLVLAWPGGVLFAVFSCSFFLRSGMNWDEGRAVVNATLAQGEFAASFHRAFEPLRKVCPENLLLGIGLRPIYSATTQTTI